MPTDTSTQPAAELLAQGQQLLLQGERDAALAAFNIAASQCHAAGDRLGLHHALRSIAKVYMQAAQFDLALPAAMASAKVALAMDSPDLRMVCQLAAGICHGMMANYADSGRQMVAAYEGAVAAGLVDLQWACLANLVLLSCLNADELRRAGHDRQALSVLRLAGQRVAAGDRMAEPDDAYVVTLWRANRAGWLRRVGRLDEARRAYEQVYASAMAENWVDAVRHASLGLALIHLERDQAAAAEPWLVRCIAAGDTLDCYGFVNEAHRRLAQWHKESGNDAAAQRHLAHGARQLDALHAERRRMQQAVAAVAFDVERAFGPAPL